MSLPLEQQTVNFLLGGQTYKLAIKYLFPPLYSFKNIKKLNTAWFRSNLTVLDIKLLLTTSVLAFNPTGMS